jgi:hypothetical protein
LLWLAVFALSGLVLLLGGALLIGGGRLSSESISPSLSLPVQARVGLGRAGANRGLDVTRNHRAYVRRPASVAERRFAVRTPSASAPAAADPGSHPVDLQPAVPAPLVESPIFNPSPAGPPSGSPVFQPQPPAPQPPSPPAPEAEPPTPPSESAPALVEADFESGLAGWSTAGAGDVVPQVTTDIVREGAKASRVRLTGEQDRSELILGGNGSGSTAGTIRFHEGDEYFYGFSFYIETMVYGEPGAHNLIMQFKSDDGGSPNFGLQLWDYAGDGGRDGGRGLWSHGGAMGGDRFLAPVPERVWHDVVIHFKASSVGAGFYEVFLDGALTDSRSGVSMIVPGASYAYIKDGLYRNGEEIPGTSEIRLDGAKLGETMESVLP